MISQQVKDVLTGVMQKIIARDHHRDDFEPEPKLLEFKEKLSNYEDALSATLAGSRDMNAAREAAVVFVQSAINVADELDMTDVEFMYALGSLNN